LSTEIRRYRAGDRIEDMCRACKIVRVHSVQVTGPDGRPMRVVCDYCGSLHNYRGGGERVAVSSSSSRPATTVPSHGALEPFPIVSERERSEPPMSPTEAGGAADIEMLLRRIIREEAGLTPVAPADKWRGGDMILRPGKPGLQERVWPIETFFHKVVMIRNRLRVLEQQINALEYPGDVKAKLQAHITGCYGSLTSFNLLFAEEDDRFRGVGTSD
jgi:hypothetical protein